MTTLLSPTIDLVFKALFIKNNTLLLDLLNQIMYYYQLPCLNYIEVKNPELLPETEDEKTAILDIFAKDEHKREYDIEMQAEGQRNYPERSLYYLSKM